MKSLLVRLPLAPLLFALTTLTASAGDWPQWQGPARTAMSAEKGLLQEWPAGGPAQTWKAAGIGTGYGGISVSNGLIFSISNRGAEEVAWAISEKDGSPVWSTKLGAAVTEGRPQGIEGPGCTPTIDGDRVYVIGAAGALACLQRADGKIVWQKNMVSDFGGQVPAWRYNESPLIDGDKVICTPGAPDATMLALNKATGDVVWKSVATGGAAAPEQGRRGGRGGGGGGGANSTASYASAIVAEIEGVRQYVQLTATALVGVAATDGKLLWSYAKPANSNRINCSSPIFTEGLVFAASAYGNGGGAAKITKGENGELKAEEVYFTTNMQNHHGGMIVLDNALYGAAGGNEGGFLVCLNYPNGEVLWRERKAPKGSLLYADGRLYLRAEGGAVILFEPSREKFIERGRFDQPNRTDKPAWTHPIIANGKLYIRDQDTLYCYDVKAGG